jgi:GntR family transcriptional regulator / MocR family aminotransferase
MDVVITLDTNSPIPLHQQLYQGLRQAILFGRLSPRGRIPSTRSLAKSLGISRTTVTQSYEQLLSEGYLETVIGSGTFVCSQLPDDLLHSSPVESEGKIARPAVKLTKYAANLAQTENVPRIPEAPLPITFRYGRPAFDEKSFFEGQYPLLANGILKGYGFLLGWLV